MKNFTLALLLLFFIQRAYSQTENPLHKPIADRVEAFYNNAAYDSIFHLFSDGMKKALPLDKTINFLSGLQSGAGKITSRQFEKYQSGYALYKTRFEKGTFSFNLAFDNELKIAGLFVKPYAVSTSTLKRNSTKLVLPFKEEWTVIWGGDTKELNYHVESPAQKNAFDLVITDSQDKSYKTNGSTNEDFYAFGKELFAPCDAEVVLVVDGIKDNKPGTMNPIYIPGNTVILKTSGKEYLFFAHFKQYSIKVKPGQKIRQGDLLGLCGNSGNSSEPHIHYHMQDVEDMNTATGVKSYFDKLQVNGKPVNDYSPIKGDKIKPIN